MICPECGHERQAAAGALGGLDPPGSMFDVPVVTVPEPAVRLGLGADLGLLGLLARGCRSRRLTLVTALGADHRIAAGGCMP